MSKTHLRCVSMAWEQVPSLKSDRCSFVTNKQTAEGKKQVLALPSNPPALRVQPKRTDLKAFDFLFACLKTAQLTGKNKEDCNEQLITRGLLTWDLFVLVSKWKCLCSHALRKFHCLQEQNLMNVHEIRQEYSLEDQDHNL